MKNVSNEAIAKLNKLAVSKIALLEALQIRMQTTLDKATEENIEEIDSDLESNKEYFLKINCIDKEFNGILRTLDNGSSSVIRNFLQSSDKENDIPEWCAELCSYLFKQHDLLLKLADMNEKLTDKITAFSSGVKDQLVILKRQKTIHNNYVSNHRSKAGKLFDIKEI